jgi:hypothetical protein
MMLPRMQAESKALEVSTMDLYSQNEFLPGIVKSISTGKKCLLFFTHSSYGTRTGRVDVYVWRVIIPLWFRPWTRSRSKEKLSDPFKLFSSLQRSSISKSSYSGSHRKRTSLRTRPPVMIMRSWLTLGSRCPPSEIENCLSLPRYRSCASSYSPS